MSSFLILHGTDGSPQSNWFMWLKGLLVGKGHNIWLPQLPNSNKPDTAEYTRFLLDNPKFEYGSDTTLIGHSSGAVEILHLLQNLPDGVQVKAAVLVSAFNDDLGWDSLQGLFVEPLDFERIKKACSHISFIHSGDDPYAPLEQARFLAEQTDGELIVFEEQGHFNLEQGPEYKQFPELLDFIDC